MSRSITSAWVSSRVRGAWISLRDQTLRHGALMLSAAIICLLRRSRHELVETPKKPVDSFRKVPNGGACTGSASTGGAFTGRGRTSASTACVSSSASSAVTGAREAAGPEHGHERTCGEQLYVLPADFGEAQCVRHAIPLKWPDGPDSNSSGPDTGPASSICRCGYTYHGDDQLA